MFKRRLILLIYLLFYGFIGHSQSIQETINRELDVYLKELSQKNVKSYIIFESSYYNYDTANFSNLISKEIKFYVISQHKDLVRLQRFESGKNYTPDIVNNFKGFKFINERKQSFKVKDEFLDGFKYPNKIFFLPPMPVAHYISMSVKLPELENKFTMINERFDPIGVKISDQSWFNSLKEITDYLQDYIAKVE